MSQVKIGNNELVASQSNDVMKPVSVDFVLGGRRTSDFVVLL